MYLDSEKFILIFGWLVTWIFCSSSCLYVTLIFFSLSRWHVTLIFFSLSCWHVTLVFCSSCHCLPSLLPTSVRCCHSVTRTASCPLSRNSVSLSLSLSVYSHYIFFTLSVYLLTYICVTWNCVLLDIHAYFKFESFLQLRRWLLMISPIVWMTAVAPSGRDTLGQTPLLFPMVWP